MATTPLTSNNAHGDHHVTPPSTYWVVLAALTVLMLVTIGASQVAFGDIGPISGVWLNNGLAILIAVIKALLVIFFFMGVKHASALTRIWVSAGFIVFAVMYFIAADHLTRKYEVVQGWQEKEGSAFPRVLDPLNERQEPPRDVDINVRPRQ